MKTHASFPRFFLLAATSILLTIGFADEASSPEPTMLDLARFHRERFTTEENNTFATVAGYHVFDGIPFNVRGRGCLYGTKEGLWTGSAEAKDAPKFPDFVGIRVNRTFEELHILHACRWAEVPGETIAFVRLNYTDDTHLELPIKFGVHTRDWQRLRTEEKETLADPDSKIIWRNEQKLTVYKGTTRLFKSRFENPFPKKVVGTIDFVSAKKMASLDVVAATVTNRDSSRAISPAVASSEPERQFDGACVVRVFDAESGRPLAGVIVDSAMDVDQAGRVICIPTRTDTEGKAVLYYPKGRVSCYEVDTTAEGFVYQETAKQGELPDLITLKLKRQDGPDSMFTGK